MGRIRPEAQRKQQRKEVVLLIYRCGHGVLMEPDEADRNRVAALTMECDRCWQTHWEGKLLRERLEAEARDEE